LRSEVVHKKMRGRKRDRVRVLSLPSRVRLRRKVELVPSKPEMGARPFRVTLLSKRERRSQREEWTRNNEKREKDIKAKREKRRRDEG
jgi:hypothetical protein